MDYPEEDRRLAVDGEQWHGRAGPVFAGNLAFEHVSYGAGGKLILRDISFSLEAGKIACLLGPSGCGKSTLLKLAAGVLKLRGGRILLDGQEVAGPSMFVPPERRSVGLMFQDFALFPHMTALDNVAFGLTALRREEARRVAMLALERVGLGAFAQNYPVSLSGGEQQRVALARTIVPRPQVILMDEPFSSLDQRLRESIRDDTLSILRETRATALLVTHDPAEALAFADRLFLMRAGEIVQSGSPEEVQKHPVDAEAARLFRSYNEFSGQVVHACLASLLGPIPTPGVNDGTQVRVLVPPEDVRLLPAQGEDAARVLESRHVGPDIRIKLLAGARGEVISAVVPGRVAPKVGETFSLVLDPRNTHIFPG